MPHLTDLLIIIWADLLAVMSPGPDLFLVLKNTIKYPRRIALYTPLGITSGVMIYVLLCLTSLSWIQTQTPTLFKNLKYIGSAYLLFLGIKILIENPTPVQIDADYAAQPKIYPKNIARRVFYEGLLCNLLNPKAALFFIGIFSITLKPTTPPIFKITAFLSISTISLAWFSLITFVFSGKRARKKLSTWQKPLLKILGLFLITISVIWLVEDLL